MPNIIIGLTGKPVAGKTTIASYLQEKYDAQVFRFSTVLRQILELLGQPITRRELQNLSTLLRQRYGEDVLAKSIALKTDTAASSLVVVDGIRRIMDLKYLQENKNFALIRIVADPEIRFQRLNQRQENADDQQKTLAEFLEDEKQEAEQEISRVMQQARFEIINNSSFNNLYQQIDKIIKTLQPNL